MSAWPRLTPFSSALITATGLVCLALTAGCTGSSSDVDEPTVQTPAGEEATDGTTSPARSVARHGDLSPVIRPVGAAGVAPSAISVSFLYPVTDGAVAATEDTVLKISPDVPGELTFTDSKTLRFTPKNGFRPGVTYTASLESVQTPQGKSAAKGDGWKTSFSTPQFSFVRMVPHAIHSERGEFDLDLVFSGPVNPDSVKRHLTFTYGEAVLPSVRVTPHSTHSNRVRVRLSSPALAKNNTLRLALARGARSALDQSSAKSGKAVFDIDATAKEMEVKGLHLVEGSSSHYVQVVCDDDASSEDKWWVWFNELRTDYYLSPRCELDESVAKEAISIHPAVDFSVSPTRGGFRILGNFSRGTYHVSIDAGAKTSDGGVLKQTYEADLTVGALSPRISYSSKGRYLPPDNWNRLAVQHRNVDQLDLTIRHVPKQNLIFWMTGDSEEADERTSNVVLSEKIPVNGTADIMDTTWVDLASLLPNPDPGVYQLEITGEGNSRDVSRLMMTNLQLVAKSEALEPDSEWSRRIFTWALDMHSTKAKSGVKVQAIRPSGKVLASCTTSSSGGCILEVPKDEVDATGPFALLATKGTDLTYLKFNELRTDLSENDVSGEPYVSERKYRASVYTDRGVYRPGETAHVAAILRNEDNVAPDKDLPVEAHLFDSRSKLVRTAMLTSNDAGMVTWDLDFADYASTGQYRVDLLVGKNKVSDTQFNVEEFVPERLKVTASAVGSAYLDTDAIPVDIDAQYLFGGSAKESRVELTCRLESSTFKPKENAQFHYGPIPDDKSGPQSITLGTVSGVLGEDGDIQLTCPSTGKGSGFRGASKLKADVAVFESGSGRTTHASATVPVHPGKAYVGLSTGVEKLKPGQSFSVEGMVVDWNGKAVTADKKVTVALLRMESEWGWHYDPQTGDESYRRILRPVMESKQEVTPSKGKFSAKFTAAGSAEKYLVRATLDGMDTELHIDGEYRYWWSPRDSSIDQTPRPHRPTSLALTAPESIEVGKRSSVNLTVPYKGRMLMTVESNQVIRSEWLDVSAGPLDWTFTIDEFAPNVYVSAFLVKDPHLDSDQAFLPDRAFGVQTVPVRPTEFTHTVKLNVPTEVRPHETLKVDVDLGALSEPTYVTVAAIDEGILSLTGFKTPDPQIDIFPNRRLGIDTYETVGWSLLTQPAGPSSAHGGDGMEAPGRVQMVKPVALWSGLVEVPKSGKATVEFEVPQYQGALRVMVVAGGSKKTGSADAKVIVRDPLVLQTTVPRFLIAGDQAQIPVFVTNMSGQDQTITVNLDADILPVPGVQPAAKEQVAITFLGDKEATFKLKKGESRTSVFQVKATAPVGAAKFRVQAKAGSLVSFEELDVPFTADGPRVRELQQHVLAQGLLDVDALMDDSWVSGSERTTFWVTNNPYGRSFSHLKYLVRYPYGCIEQTTSSTRPLLFVSNLLPAVDPEMASSGEIEDKVMHGVSRVLSMQTPSGGFAYWPGGSEPNVWGTAYGTHMLLDAQAAGYAVPPLPLEDALKYLETEVDRSDQQYYYGHIYRFGEPYLHYVLARADRGRKARVIKLVEHLSGQATEGEYKEQLYMLKAALYLMGDRRYERDLRNPDTTPINWRRKNDWRFYSDLRRRGFMLSIYQDLFGSDGESGEKLARLVGQSLEVHPSSRYYTTQELVWSVTGLGKWVEGGAANWKPPTLSGNGKALSSAQDLTGKKGNQLTWAVTRASEYQELSLNVSDPGEGKLYLIINSEGVKSDQPYKTGGQGLKVSRDYRTADGDPLDPSRHALGDLVYTRVSISNTSKQRVQNIALVDRFPAGWEIENPRLGRGGELDWVDSGDVWTTDHMNLRDDRMEVFGNLGPGETRSIVYGVRAVTAGTFTAPPVEAEAMYDPDVWAREAGETIVIQGPWAGSLL